MKLFCARLAEMQGDPAAGPPLPVHGCVAALRAHGLHLFYLHVVLPAASNSTAALPAGA